MRYSNAVYFLRYGKYWRQHLRILDDNSTVEDTSISGGCLRRYEWCAYTSRVPLIIYVFSFIVILGFAFPFTSAPLGTVFSEILGPRKQVSIQWMICMLR